MDSELCLRKARMSDCRILYNFRMDREVRKNSFHHETFPYDAHRVWYQRLLEDPDKVQYVLEEDGVPVGQIRIAKEGDDGVIGYSIDAPFRGKGYGTRLLLLAEENVRKDLPGVRTLVGEVLPENLPSQHAFEKDGYQKAQVLEDRIVYRKEL